MITTIEQLPSLTAQLNDISRQMAGQLPGETMALLEDFIRDLKESGIASQAVQKGAEIPRFELPNALGEYVRSFELLARGPLVISFYRGGWCPYCSLELQALTAALPLIQDYGASLVAISPQTPDNSLSTREKLGLEFEVLSDVGSSVAREFGLVFSLSEPMQEFFKVAGFNLPEYNGDSSWELPIPATYVVDQDGIVAAKIDPDWTQRMEPRDIINALKDLPS